MSERRLAEIAIGTSVSIIETGRSPRQVKGTLRPRGGVVLEDDGDGVNIKTDGLLIPKTYGSIADLQAAIPQTDVGSFAITPQGTWQLSDDGPYTHDGTTYVTESGGIEAIAFVSAGTGLSAAPDQTLLGNQTGSTATPTPIDTAEVVARRENARSFIAPFETVADLAARTPVDGLQAVTMAYTQLGVDRGQYWVGVEGSALEFTGRKGYIIPASGPGSDGSRAWKPLEIEHPGVLFAIKRGFAPDATASYNAGALQDAFDEVLENGAALKFGPGIHQIDAGVIVGPGSPIVYGSGAGRHYTTAFNGSTMFDWRGGDEEALFSLQGTRDAVFSSFYIYANTNALWTGIQMITLLEHQIAGRTMGHNQFDHITMQGNAGKIGYGFRCEHGVDANDWNNAEHSYNHVSLKGLGSNGGAWPDSSGWRIIMGQSKQHTIYQCSANSQGNGMAYCFYGHGSGQIRSFNGACDDTMFRITPNDTFSVDGVSSEDGNRLLLTEGGTAASHVSLKNARFDCLFSEAVNSGDGIVVNHTSGGNLTIENITMNNAPHGKSVYIRANNNFVPSHISVLGGEINSKNHPLLVGGNTSYDFRGVAKDVAKRSGMWADATGTRARVQYIESSPFARVTHRDSFVRPLVPRRGEWMIDRELDAPIYWSEQNSRWNDAAGAAAGAAFSPAAAGTLLGAWDVSDPGVTESGGYITSVPAAYGTSGALSPLVGNYIRAMDESGFYVMYGEDETATLQATLAGGALAHWCTIYAWGRMSTQGTLQADGTVVGNGGGIRIGRIFTTSNGAIDGGTADLGSGEEGLYATAGATANGSAISSSAADRAFNARWGFNDATSTLRFEASGQEVVADNVNPGTDDGSDTFVIGGSALCRLQGILIYSGAVDESKLRDWLRHRAAVGIYATASEVV